MSLETCSTRCLSIIEFLAPTLNSGKGLTMVGKTMKKEDVGDWLRCGSLYSLLVS